ncbi:hypothetical protein B0H13DRAFT_1894474 [Mycena leptocephala]|nr:hypothetical protein B0H13DRAFT_1894474 [Mycena leptocephala]
MASVDRSESVSHGRHWKDTSKEVRQAFRNDFNIPEHIASTILPSDGISIHALMEFTLPRVTAQDVLETSTYFSLYSPDTVDSSVILRLRHLDMPPVTVIRRLAQEAQQAWLDGFKSVKLEVRKPWTGVRDWLKKQMEQRKNSQVRTHATEAIKLLGVLPWNGRKRGLSDKSPIHSLWRFLGTEWLSSTDENDMLEILSDRIASDPDLVGRVRVEAVELTAKITKAFEGRENRDYVDGPQRLFLYGDSFGGEIPPTLRQAYEWWAPQHTTDALEFGTLPTSTLGQLREILEILVDRHNVESVIALGRMHLRVYIVSQPVGAFAVAAHQGLALKAAKECLKLPPRA